jgi:methylmalonyl-CoA mutase
MADHLAALCRPTPAAAPAFHLDPLSAFARSGASPGPVESHLVSAATTAVRLAGHLPNASLFLASGRPAHEAGGGEAQELGLALAAALAYAKAGTRAGLSMERAFRGIVLGLSADADTFVTIAKLRAARALWARLTAACGVEGAQAVIEARSSRRMLAAVDPWVNLLRLTAAGFGAALGGADAVILDAFTDPLGLPTAFARRQARNTQLVLMEEAHLGRVADPAAGSGYVESLTDQLARAGWAVFQAIERQGGVVRALESGAFQAEVAAVRDRRLQDVARRKAGLIGVSEFPNLSEAVVAVEDADPAVFARPAPTVRLPGPDSGCEPLAPIRWAEPFERLRGRDASRPVRAYVAALGPAAEHAARIGFTRNLLGAGGVDAAVGPPDGYDGAPAAVLAGADERYAAEALQTARALKARGARLVLLAGRPGPREAEFKDAGVDGYVYAGGDALAALERVHAAQAD